MLHTATVHIDLPNAAHLISATAVHSFARRMSHRLPKKRKEGCSTTRQYKA
jgi:hypothetical protein